MHCQCVGVAEDLSPLIICCLWCSCVTPVDLRSRLVSSTAGVVIVDYMARIPLTVDLADGVAECNCQ